MSSESDNSQVIRIDRLGGLLHLRVYFKRKAEYKHSMANKNHLYRPQLPPSRR